MMKYTVILSYILYNICIIIGCIFMAFYISQGASLWLILVMSLLVLSLGLPNYRKINKCPKCGYDMSDDPKKEENTDGDK